MTNTIRTRSPASGQFVTQMNNVIRQICLATLLVLIGFASAAQATTVSLSAPSSGATYAAGSNITVSASASPSTGQTITKVDFYRGATLIATDTSKPYSIIWPAVPAGSYSLTAKATTNTGAVTTSGARTITVAAAPSVSLAAPANNAAFAAGSTIALSATATATGQTITKVDFYRGTTLIRSDTTAPYTATWSNAAAGNYSLTTRVTTSLGLTATSALVAVTVAAAPTISLTAPANNAVFGVGSNITIAATAAATGQTITQVDFYSGAALLGTATAAPYSFNWSNLPAGSYSLTARVTTSIGLTATSTATAISVAAAPSVSLTAPANNTAATAPASFTLSATASAASGQTISKVDFYSGATLLGTATAAPYSYIWGNVPAGSYSLTARATDSLGSVTTSTAATVAVNAPPTIALTAPANNSAATAPANLIVSADAADSDGSIAYVVFYASTGQAQATQIGILNTAPYSLNWSNVAAGNYQIIATATDNLGAVTLSSPISVTVNAPAQAGQALYFIETDHLDTPRQMSDAAGNVVWRWENLDAFGNNPPNDDPNGTGQHHTFNLRFPGQYYDAETGTNYNYYRDYDPSTGRYVQSDPIGLAGGINGYVYALSNPLRYVDPWGLDTFVANRDLSAFGNSARPSSDVVTHTFTFSTNPDGSIAHTYSWGNDANLRGWNLDQPIDMSTAAQAIQQGLAQPVAPGFMDTYYRKAYDQLNRPENEHSNGVVVNNCKAETKKLNDLAWKLWSGK